MTSRLKLLLGTLSAGAVLSLSAPSAHAEPDVVVSILPVHSLVAGVMKGVGEPRLLLRGGASPHTYTLRPSEARALSNADAIFWIGEDMESFLAKPLEALGRDTAVVELADAEGIHLLRAREGGAWDVHGHGDHDDSHEEATHDHGEEDHKEATHQHDHDDDGHEDAAHRHDHDEDSHAEAAHDHDKHDHDEHGHKGAAREDGHHDHEHEETAHAEHGDHDDHAHGEHNLHIWLDPENAHHMVEAIVAKLSAIDPDNAAVYAANGETLETQLEVLETALRERLQPIQNRPYLVFHDAYHYFEDRFGTNAVGSITVAPDRQPGARRIAELRDRIADNGAVCVFSEPQFEPAIVRSLVESTAANAGELDPLGVNIAPGPDAYFRLMENLAASMRECLVPAS